MSFTPKLGNDIRICVDMKRVNRTGIRKSQPTPTVEDITHDMNGATRFTKSTVNLSHVLS